MRKIAALVALAILALAAGHEPAQAQSTTCAFLAQYRYVPTNTQWLNCLNSKQDLLAFTPLNSAGGVMSGRLVILNPTTPQAPLNLLPMASDPTSKANGDIWVTSTAIKAQVGNVTYNLLALPITSLTQLPAIATGTFLGNTSGGPASPSALAITTLAANPTATAGATAVNGTAATFMRSDAAPAVASATNAAKGIVQCDGTTIGCTAGVATVPTGSNSAKGIVQCDGSSATCAAGTVSVPTGTAAAKGIVQCDGTSILCSSGVISANVPVMFPQGRLTLTSGTPIMTATTSGSTIYYTPAVGLAMPIYNGTTWTSYQFVEVAQALSDTTKSPAAAVANGIYDVFCWVDSGVNRCTRGPAWQSSVARGTGAGTTAITRVDGILLNVNAITNGPGALRGTYVGTIAVNGGGTVEWTYGSSASGGGYSFFGIWNQYNRHLFASNVVDSGVSYTYSSSTVRVARGSGNYFFKMIAGDAQATISSSYTVLLSSPATSGAFAFWGIGFDLTSAFYLQKNTCQTAAATAISCASSNVVNINPGLGLHSVYALEQGDGSSSFTYDASGAGNLSSLVRM